MRIVVSHPSREGLKAETCHSSQDRLSTLQSRKGSNAAVHLWRRLATGCILARKCICVEPVGQLKRKGDKCR